LTVLLGFLLIGGGLTSWSFIALVAATFFLASAGASAAYLTVSEIFPMETRALAIVFFYAVGTGVMALGGSAELLFGVRAERTPLENIARPMTVADPSLPAATPTAEQLPAEQKLHPAHLAALRDRARGARARPCRRASGGGS
jgi:hypothetical protein